MEDRFVQPSGQLGGRNPRCIRVHSHPPLSLGLDKPVFHPQPCKILLIRLLKNELYYSNIRSLKLKSFQYFTKLGGNVSGHNISAMFASYKHWMTQNGQIKLFCSLSRRVFIQWLTIVFVTVFRQGFLDCKT